MRAAEIGMRALGKTVGVEFPNHPIELAEWLAILSQADAKIKAMQQLPKTAQKDEELKFYSQAGVHFLYFKDAWRVRVAHARETFEEGPALRILDHTRDFFEIISDRLSEQTSEE
jgi:hypothetical protein